MVQPSNKHALLSVAEMYAADRAAIDSGVPGETLMENAGRAVAEVIADRFPLGPTLILCGPGNNGGDGFVAARLLADWGWPVRVSLLGERTALKGDAAIMAGRWEGAVEALDETVEHGGGDASLIVDALFGAGLSRGLDGAPAAIMEQVSRSGVPIVSIDMPSGVCGDTGTDLGGAQQAALTVTFFREKTGHLLLPGRSLCGTCVVADIGIPDAVLDDAPAAVRRNHPGLWHNDIPTPGPTDHKYSRGHAVVAGGPEMLGAARLATRAAQRTGAGMVTLASPMQQAPLYRLALESALVPVVKDTKAFADLLDERKVDAALIGPGLGLMSPGALERVLTILRSGRPCVLDADALTLFQESPSLLFETASAPVVITPHEGEFARLFPDLADSGEVIGKISRARKAAQRSGFTVLLKGFDSVIASPEGQVVVNANATPDLATAGSGDVLAGICVGFLAQGMDPFQAASAAAWIHAEIGARIGRGLIAEDLPDQIPEIITLLKDNADESA